jgi:hypothetical protein
MTKRKALATPLDSNEAVRAALIARIVKAAATAPVALLHTVAQGLEMNQ